jgi:FG-GAP-like repeat
MRLRESCGRLCRALVRAAWTALEWGRAPGCIGSVVWRARAVAVLRATVFCWAWWLVVASVASASADVSFTTGAPRTVGSAPTSVAVGDFTGNGIDDLAVANQDSDTVSVLLGNGDGTFKTAVNYAVEQLPSSVADFTGNGIEDLAVANYGSGTVSVPLGNGDGTFKGAVNYTVGTGPWSVAVGDFSGNGIEDLAVTSYSSGTVSVLLGNGDGTFKTAVNYATYTGPFSVAVGDFTGNGIEDLAVASANAGTASVLLGTGDGTFQTASNYTAVRSEPESVAVGDFTRDGKPDLAVANVGSGDVSVLLNSSEPALGASSVSPFASTAVGSDSASRALMLTNTGFWSLTIAEVTPAGGDGDEFTANAAACTSGPVMPGASCTVGCGLTRSRPERRARSW